MWTVACCPLLCQNFPFREQIWRHRSDYERHSVSGLKIVDGVEGLVGNTPLVRIKSLSAATGCDVSSFDARPLFWTTIDSIQVHSLLLSSIWYLWWTKIIRIYSKRDWFLYKWRSPYPWNECVCTVCAHASPSIFNCSNYRIEQSSLAPTIVSLGLEYMTL